MLKDYDPIGRCRDCKHWDQKYADPEWGECARRLNEDGPVYIRHSGDEDPALVTQADFGCVMWEYKS